MLLLDKVLQAEVLLAGALLVVEGRWYLLCLGFWRRRG